MDTTGGWDGNVMRCDSNPGVGDAAGSAHIAHQVRLVPSTRPQHPTMAMTGPGHLRRAWRVSSPPGYPPVHQTSSFRHPRRSCMCWR